MTLTKLAGGAFPVTGGKYAGIKADPTINANGTWTNGTIQGLYGTTYAFRVDGTFDNGTKTSSAYVTKDVTGNAPPTTEWPILRFAQNFPVSGGAGTISAKGTYSRSVVQVGADFRYIDTSKDGIVVASFSTGGPLVQQKMTFVAADGSWSTPDLAFPGTVPAGTQCTVVGAATGTDGALYCTSVVNIPVQAKP